MGSGPVLPSRCSSSSSTARVGTIKHSCSQSASQVISAGLWGTKTAARRGEVTTGSSVPHLDRVRPRNGTLTWKQLASTVRSRTAPAIGQPTGGHASHLESVESHVEPVSSADRLQPMRKVDLCDDLACLIQIGRMDDVVRPAEVRADGPCS